MPYILLDPATAEAAPVTTAGAPLTPVLPATTLPGMNLAEMRTQLDIQLGGRMDFDDTMFDLWINQSYSDLCSSLEIPELNSSLLITTVVGQPLYNLPPQVRAIDIISVIDSTTYGDLGGAKLTKIDKNRYRRSPNLQNEPREYFRQDKMLVLWPTPSAARSLSIDYFIRPDWLTDEDHYPIIPPEWHEVIVRNARTKAHSDLREFESAGITNNEVVGLVRRKSDPEAAEDEDRVIGSSVPRRRSQLSRRHTNPGPDADGIY
jgi:hypothetical protein